MTPEQRARVDLITEASAGGLDWHECSAYADYMLATRYGRSLVIRYAAQDVRAELLDRLDRSWVGRLVRRASR